MNCVDKQYIEIVKDVLANGHLVPTRAKINGNNVSAYTVFGRQARFKLLHSFPILTTKKVSFDSIAHEVVWFLSGDSNIKYLQDNKVKIWDAWADKDGELGFGTYGTLWRKFPNHQTKAFDNYGEGNFFQEIVFCENQPVDQIKELINNIEAVKKDPTASCGRRLIVTAWHPYYVDKVGLPPCHCLFQFHVNNKYLSCQLYQRSCDLFLGVPFNITSYCLLLSVIAKITNLVPHEFVHTYGDLHIYENHVEQLQDQIEREPMDLPQLWINPELNSIDDFVRSDVKLIDYNHRGVLRGEVAV